MNQSFAFSLAGPVVYRLGPMVFIHKSWVRLPAGLQKGISYNGYYDGFANHKLGFNSLYLHRRSISTEVVYLVVAQEKTDRYRHRPHHREGEVRYLTGLISQPKQERYLPYATNCPFSSDGESSSLITRRSQVRALYRTLNLSDMRAIQSSPM